MAKKRARALAITSPSVSLDPRDGPNEQYLTHHSVISRGGRGAVGKRKLGQAEQLLRETSNQMTPAAFDALQRFARNYERTFGRSSISLPRLMDGTPGGSGGGFDLAPITIDNASTHRAACVALISAGPPPRMRKPLRLSPTTIVELVAVHDASMSALALRLGCCRKTARRVVCYYASVLAEHYAEIDTARGRVSTPFTKELALRSVDPDDPVP